MALLKLGNTSNICFLPKHPVGYNQSCQIFHAPVSTKMLLEVRGGAPEYNQVNKKNRRREFLFFICFSMWKISRNKQSPAIVTQKCTIVQSIYELDWCHLYWTNTLLTGHQQPARSKFPLFKRTSNHQILGEATSLTQFQISCSTFSLGKVEKIRGFRCFCQQQKKLAQLSTEKNSSNTTGAGLIQSHSKTSRLLLRLRARNSHRLCCM